MAEIDAAAAQGEPEVGWVADASIGEDANPSVLMQLVGPLIVRQSMQGWDGFWVVLFFFLDLI